MLMPQTGFNPDAEAVVLLSDHSNLVATMVSGSEGKSGYRTPRGTELVGPALRVELARVQSGSIFSANSELSA